VISSSKLWIWL